MNGDGVPDLIVGASGATPGRGAAYVYSGRTGSLLFRNRGERHRLRGRWQPLG